MSSKVSPASATPVRARLDGQSKRLPTETTADTEAPTPLMMALSSELGARRTRPDAFRIVLRRDLVVGDLADGRVVGAWPEQREPTSPAVSPLLIEDHPNGQAELYVAGFAAGDAGSQPHARVLIESHLGDHIGRGDTG